MRSMIRPTTAIAFIWGAMLATTAVAQVTQQAPSMKTGPSSYKLNPAREARINALMAKMSLEDKVGQMTQVTLDVVLKSGTSVDASDPVQIDPGKLKEALETYHVGSI